MFSIESLIAQCQKEFDSKRMANYQIPSLPKSCRINFHAGSGVLEVFCESDNDFRQVARFELEKFAQAPVERVIIRSAKGGVIEAPVEDLALAFNHESASTTSKAMNTQLQNNLAIDKEVLKTLEKVYTSEAKPRSIVSLVTHRNRFFNQAFCNMLSETPSEITSRDLRLLWFKPEELTPEAITNPALIPNQLQEVLSELNFSGFLQARKYEGWLGNQRGLWTSDIELVIIQGEPHRMMTSLDFKPFS